MPEPALIDEVDRALIDHLQGGFPICDEPYAEVAGWLGIDEAELLERLARLLATRVLTRFGPMFQVEQMGGAFVLAAMAVPDGDWPRVRALVDSLPEVAHNYRRESERQSPFNMWFVLATESEEGIAAALRRIEEGSGLPVFSFPKRREYFVEMKLAVRR
jgi:DNA-binding Lrp family transcriptional regulator